MPYKSALDQVGVCMHYLALRFAVLIKAGIPLEKGYTLLSAT